MIEAVVDPEFPMMPPHVTFKEAMAFGKSVIKGDPSAGHMIKETVKTAVASLLKTRKPEK